ncbi:hypothetical protein AYO37_00440 [Opitutia bacterium SCGC AG-212-L18]|nr:hypothetical protein AYO37_00440 [Opitutae bacterium SCGC AG-212-L18]
MSNISSNNNATQEYASYFAGAILIGALIHYFIQWCQGKPRVNAAGNQQGLMPQAQPSLNNREIVTSKSKTLDSLDIFPAELLLEILRLVDPKDIATFRLLNKTLKAVAEKISNFSTINVYGIEKLKELVQEKSTLFNSVSKINFKILIDCYNQEKINELLNHDFFKPLHTKSITFEHTFSPLDFSNFRHLEEVCFESSRGSIWVELAPNNLSRINLGVNRGGITQKLNNLKELIFNLAADGNLNLDDVPALEKLQIKTCRRFTITNKSEHANLRSIKINSFIKSSHFTISHPLPQLTELDFGGIDSGCSLSLNSNHFKALKKLSCSTTITFDERGEIYTERVSIPQPLLIFAKALKERNPDMIFEIDGVIQN